MAQAGDAAAGFGIFDGARYLNLETYRRDGTAVRTPLWFAASGGVLYVYSLADAGKVKRVRRDGRVRVAPCDLRGGITGPWVDAVAAIVAEEEHHRAMKLLDRKYFPWKTLLGLLARLRPRPRAVIRLSAR